MGAPHLDFEMWVSAKPDDLLVPIHHDSISTVPVTLTFSRPTQESIMSVDKTMTTLQNRKNTRLDETR